MMYEHLGRNDLLAVEQKGCRITRYKRPVGNRQGNSEEHPKKADKVLDDMD